MEEFITKSGQRYVLVTDYKYDENLRGSFNELTRKIYGFDFEDWYASGYWTENYKPYSLVDGERIIANVSVNIMHFWILGHEVKAIQLSHLMTDEAYRKQGLAHWLLQYVIKKWETECEFLYLFAPGEAFESHFKLGFKKVREYQTMLSVKKQDLSIVVRKLDMQNEEDRYIFHQMENNAWPFAEVSMRDNTGLVMLHCLSDSRYHMYYLQEYDTVAIARVEGEILYLDEVFSKGETPIEDIIEALIEERTKKVVFGFTPRIKSRWLNYKVVPYKNENAILFMKSKNEILFEKNKWMFPVLSHA